jgi:hypothetical protein
MHWYYVFLCTYIYVPRESDLTSKHAEGYELMYDLILFLLMLIYIDCGVGLTFIVHFCGGFRAVNMDYPLFI